MSLRAVFVLCCAGVVLLVGCADSGPAVQYVEGVVLLEGTPVEGAIVAFSPVDPQKGMAAVGTTDSSGKFKLTAVQGGAPDGGTTVGQYKVAITKNSVSTMSAEEAQQMQNDPNYGKATRLSAPPKVTSVIPKKYNNPETSGVEVTVKQGSNTGDDFKFDLKKS